MGRFLLNESGDAFVDSNERHQQKYASDNAVEQPHGADVEMGSDLVDEKSDQIPPKQRSGEYAGIADDIVVISEFGQ